MNFVMKSRAERFFEGEKVEYEASGNGLLAKAVLEKTHRDRKGRHLDYIYRGSMSVSCISGFEGEVGLACDSFTFTSEGKLGKLFEEMHEKAAYFHRGFEIAAGEQAPSIDNITRCLFELRDNVEGEFLVKAGQGGGGGRVRPDLFEAYFEPYKQLKA